MSFLVCEGCSRHVRSSDAACPFCGAPTANGKVAGNPALRGARQRSALLFGAAAAAVAGATVVTGCSSSSTTALYGAPADSGVEDAGPGDDGGPVALYGAPFDAGTMEDSGGAAPAYGAPAYGGAPVDSGTD